MQDRARNTPVLLGTSLAPAILARQGSPRAGHSGAISLECWPVMRVITAILLAAVMLGALSCNPYKARAEREYSQDDTKQTTTQNDRNQRSKKSCGPSG